MPEVKTHKDFEQFKKELNRNNVRTIDIRYSEDHSQANDAMYIIETGFRASHNKEDNSFTSYPIDNRKPSQSSREVDDDYLIGRMEEASCYKTKTINDIKYSVCAEYYIYTYIPTEEEAVEIINDLNHQINSLKNELKKSEREVESLAKSFQTTQQQAIKIEDLNKDLTKKNKILTDENGSYRYHNTLLLNRIYRTIDLVQDKLVRDIEDFFKNACEPLHDTDKSFREDLLENLKKVVSYSCGYMSNNLDPQDIENEINKLIKR